MLAKDSQLQQTRRQVKEKLLPLAQKISGRSVYLYLKESNCRQIKPKREPRQSQDRAKREQTLQETHEAVVTGVLRPNHLLLHMILMILLVLSTELPFRSLFGVLLS